MKVGIEIDSRDIFNIIQTLNAYVGKEVDLNKLLIQILIKNVGSSDLLFLILQKLEENKIIRGKKNALNVLKRIENEQAKKIAEEIIKETKTQKKLFVSPLEVGKFYQCPRRLFLEKIVLSKQYKEERGKVWDGELIHLALNIFVKNMFGENIDGIITDAVAVAMNKYKNKSTIPEEKLKEFIKKFYELIKEEKFFHVFTEKTFYSFKVGLVGTPDIVCIKENGEVVPIDIKLGKLNKKGIKEEHLLQSIGEAIVVENFFRKNIYMSYLIYFESNSLVKITIDEKLIKKFLNYKKQIEKMCKFGYIPKMSNLPNFKRRVCQGCHVKPACDNIEILENIIL